MRAARPIRLAQTLTVTLVVSLSLVACGGKGQPDTNGDSAKTESAPSGGGALTRGNFNKRMLSAIEKAGSARVHFESGSGEQKARGDGEVKYGDELALRMTMTAAGNPDDVQEVIMIGDALYVGSGGKYVSMSIEAMSAEGDTNLFVNLDPKVQADAFDAAITDFKQSGAPKKLDGVKATRYVITLDPTKAPDAFGTSLTDPLTFTYYIGPDDLPRKMVYVSENGEFSATYTDWGAPVDIKAPSADKVTKGMG